MNLELLPRNVARAGEWRSNRSEATVAHQIGIEIVFMAGTESEFDQRSRIGNDSALPALVSLELAHGRLGSVVPDARWLSVEVVLADQSFLNLTRTIAGNLLLAVALPTASAQMVADARGAM